MSCQTVDIVLIQRNSRTLRFRVYDSTGTPFPLTGFDAVFMVKPTLSLPDTQAVIIKKSVGAGGGIDQIEFEELPPPGGGTPVLYGIRVYLKSADTNIDVGEYVYQLDVLNLTTGDRYTTKQGLLRADETLIKTT